MFDTTGHSRLSFLKPTLLIVAKHFDLPTSPLFKDRGEKMVAQGDMDLSACMPEGQKRAQDPISEGYVPPCGCWELNSRPLEAQSVLLTPALSLQPHKSVFLMSGI